MELETLIVRILRRSDVGIDGIAGVIDIVGSKQQRVFRDFNELVGHLNDCLNRPTTIDETKKARDDYGI